MGYGSRTMVEDGLLENPVEVATGLQVEVPTPRRGLPPSLSVSRVREATPPQVDPTSPGMHLCSLEVDPEAFATMTVESVPRTSGEIMVSLLSARCLLESLCQRLARRLYHPGAQNPQYGVRRRLL